MIPDFTVPSTLVFVFAPRATYMELTSSTTEDDVIEKDAQLESIELSLLSTETGLLPDEEIARIIYMNDDLTTLLVLVFILIPYITTLTIKKCPI